MSSASNSEEDEFQSEEEEEEEEEMADPPGGPGAGGAGGANNANANNAISSKVNLPLYFGNRKTYVDEHGHSRLGILEWISQIELFRKAGNWDPATTATRAGLSIQGEALQWFIPEQLARPAEIENWDTFRPILIERFLRKLQASEITKNENELKQGYFNVSGKPKESINQFMDRVQSALMVVSARPEQFTEAATGVAAMANLEDEDRAKLARKEMERAIRVKFLGGVEAYIAMQLAAMFHNVDINTVALDVLRNAAVTVEVAQGRDTFHPSTKPVPPVPQVAEVSADDQGGADNAVADLTKKFDALVETMSKPYGNRGNNNGRGGRFNGRGRGRGKGRGRGTNGGNTGGSNGGACFRCGKPGHFARNCYANTGGERTGGQAGGGGRVEEHAGGRWAGGGRAEGDLDYSYLSGN